MSRIKRIRVSAVIPSAAAFIAGAAGVAFATVALPDGGGQLHACYDNADGKNVQFVNKEPADCGVGQSGVTWNQTGPAGPQGPAGAGASPLQSYFVKRRNTPDASGGNRTILQLTSLPGGRYIVSATQYVLGYADCRITEGGSEVIARQEVLSRHGVGDPGSRRIFEHRIALPLNGIATVPAFGRLRLICHGNLADSRSFDASMMTAVRIGD